MACPMEQEARRQRQEDAGWPVREAARRELRSCLSQERLWRERRDGKEEEQPSIPTFLFPAHH